MPYDALLFDLDGTLIDTETVAMTTGMAAFAAMGHPVDAGFMQQLVGVDLPTAAGIIGAALPTLDQNGLQSHWHRAFAAAIDDNLPLKPGALDLLSARHRPMALVTSSGQAEAHHKLRVTGLAAHFTTIVTLADVTRPKPAPEPYLLAAERLGVSPARCLVFEDSEAGAEAAHRAGCTVVQIPDVGPVTGRWAHFQAETLLDGARLAGLCP
ncbi:MAG: HAD family phosphatase [Pseudorhodobacter sp.]|nr:MAG: HAD family phosphatase [Pseudorhodobacter sp.]